MLSFVYGTTPQNKTRTRVVTPHLGSDGRDSCGVVSTVGGGNPRLSTLRKLAQALEVSVCDLIDQPFKPKGGPQHGTDQKKGRVVRGVSRRR